MKLSKRDIAANRAQWLAKGYVLPGYDPDQVRRATLAAPEWVHFGAGNIFRAFVAAIQQQMIEEGRESKGIVVAEGYDEEIIHRAYRPYDNLFLNVTLKAQGAMEKVVVGSVAQSLGMDRAGEDWRRLADIFRGASLKMASFTITEKGYNIRNMSGEPFPQIQRDFEAGPAGAQSYIGKIAALCYTRFQAGALPISLVSMDNCAHNGTRLADALRAFAAAWAGRGLAGAAFAGYMADEAKVGFPHTMIDKITPRPDDRVIAMLQADGFEDAEAFKTAKGTFAAPFVNAEETQYLVMQDWFPNGRPKLDSARGVLFTDKETVDRVERMKVCTCLNPLHTALAVFGCLLGYTLIAEEMKDPLLRRMVEVIGRREGLPVVTDPGVIDPKEFLDTVINVRMPNAFMPDSPQRIATDTSQKLGIRFGETIKAYLKRPDLSVQSLRIIPLVFAGWLRYAMAVDDSGVAFVPSDDPLLPDVQRALAGIRLGVDGPFPGALRPILSNAGIFGVDLYAAGLGELVEGYFAELAAGPGAVRAALTKYLA
ncbi:MAG: mannitol dehydrogenase family protein [Oscillospiraceae bacterium]|nr:mannitol dehydrogenase family protein [Oscillospiraceae bacterium]